MASTANQNQVAKLIGGLRAVCTNNKSTRNLLLLSRFVEDCVEKLSDKHGLLKVDESNTIVFVNELEAAADPKGEKSDHNVCYVAFTVITQALGLNDHTNNFVKRWTAAEKNEVIRPCVDNLRAFDNELKRLIEDERQRDSNVAMIEQEVERDLHRGGTNRPAYIPTTYREPTIPDVPSRGDEFVLHKPVYTGASTSNTGLSTLETGNTITAAAASSTPTTAGRATSGVRSSVASPSTTATQPSTTPSVPSSSSRAAAQWTPAEAFHAWSSWWDRDGNPANRTKDVKQDDRAGLHNQWRRQQNLPGPDRTWAGIEQHVKFLKERSNLPTARAVYDKLRADSGN